MSLSEGCEVSYFGFSPSQAMRDSVARSLEKLLWQAPSDAFITLEYIKTGIYFRGVCRLCSAVGIFRGESVSKSFLGSLAALDKNMQRQILNWKSCRRLDEFSSQDTPLKAG